MEIKKEHYNKKGSRWTLVNVEKVAFKNFDEANKYYYNVVSDNIFKNRTEYNYSIYGRVSKKSYYSPSGKEKTTYIF